MVGRACVAWWVIGLLGCCKGGADPSPGALPSASASASALVVASASAAASSAGPTASRLGGLLGAAMWRGQVVVLATGRGGGLLLGGVGDEGGMATLPAIEGQVGEGSLVAGEGAIAALVEVGGKVMGVVGASVEGLSGGAWRVMGGATCVVGAGVVTLRGYEGDAALLWRVGVDGGEERLWKGPAGASVGLRCLEGGAALVSEEEGGTRVRWVDGGGVSEGPLLDGAKKGQDEAREVAVSGRGGCEVRVDAKGEVGLRCFEGSNVGGWAKVEQRRVVERSITRVWAAGAHVVLVSTRAERSARDCKGDDEDNVLDAWLIEREGARVVARAELDRWVCGDEPPALYGGSIDGRFVVGWPKAAASSCLRAGARHGGVGYVVLTPGKGEARGKVDVPSAGLDEAGCDGRGCAVVSLGPGEGAKCEGASAGAKVLWLPPP